ncbi:MAG: hypothetical protein MK213_09955, partial [Planctomycetes bacterium]|nr:hypothetical protein [Planctomycetota bacterium]
MEEATAIAQAAPLWNPDYLVLGLISYVVAGLLFFISVGRGRPAYRVATVFGTAANGLGVLKDAVGTKARGQAASLYFVMGSGLLIAAFRFPGGTDPLRLWVGLGALVSIAILFTLILKPMVSTTTRRLLRQHLRQHPFPLEDHLSLTREIGALFGVVPSEDETL